MSLHDIAEAANDLTELLERAAPQGLKHPRHAQHVEPARKRIKAVMAHYFERQRVAILKAIKPKIDRELRLYPPSVVVKESEAWEDEERIPSGEPGAGEWTSGGGGGVHNPPLYTESRIGDESYRMEPFQWTTADGVPIKETADDEASKEVMRSEMHMRNHDGPLPDARFRADMTPLREAASPQGRTFARNLLPVSLQPLTFAATRGEETEYNSAVSDLISAAAKSLQAAGTVGEDFAGTYLREHSLSKLTGDIASTSVERLQDALAKSWDEGGSFNSMVEAIQSTFEDFSTTRAELIAQTEANTAYAAGRRETANSLGLDEKRWNPDGEACAEICQPNADAGWISVDDDFPSGDDDIPGHPNCDCSCDYRKSSAEEE